MLKVSEAAAMLKVSERTLWSWARSGLIPHVRVGRVVLYPVDALKDWLRERAEASLRPGRRPRKQPST